MQQADIGFIGLGVMGENLILNMANRGFAVAVFNRTVSKVDAFVAGRAAGKSVIAARSIEELVAALKRPRRVMIMVKAGQAVDAVIDQLLPALEPGDIVIDGGNSYFLDTARRLKALEEKGLLFVGMGISGGEEGALQGPSIMPGGSHDAWEHIGDIFQEIAAKVEGIPCSDWIGPGGSGHFVKMVHNGIEYADMQLIAEAYWLLSRGLGLTPPQLAETFAEWNHGDLDSYLIEITSRIFEKRDERTGNYLVDMILDAASQKGTGAWTSQVALELGSPAATMAEAVFARSLSALKAERVAASKLFKGPRAKFRADAAAFKKSVHNALYASKICAYAQGFALLNKASIVNGWNLNYGAVAMLWRGGCIIRARFLHRINEAFEREPQLPNLLLDPYFRRAVSRDQSDLRRVVIQAVRVGLPVPAFSSALAWLDGYRSEQLPANLIQAQRDYFGAHTFERIDQARGDHFHEQW